LDTDEIKSRTKAFIARHFKSYEVKDDEDIFALGFVNSLFAMQLVMFVENEFQMTVEDADLHIDNFRTVNAVVGLVKRKGRHEA
jgi:methoxymalonate biosynthesis acyl carrier protein